MKPEKQLESEMAEEKIKQTTIKLPENKHWKLKIISDMREGTTLNDIVEEAVDDFIEKHKSELEKARKLLE